MFCWRGAAEVAVTFHQGVSTTPPHQAAGDCVCLWFRAISLLNAFSTVCFFHHIASKRYMLYFTNIHTYTRTHWGFVFHSGHKVKLDFRFPFLLSFMSLFCA